MTIFTAGHSTMGADDFAELLQKYAVDVAIDVRSHPGSAKWPHFNMEQMREWLPKADIGYQWWPSLGGWNASHLPLADEMRARGVDIEVYARGKFPKQRIGADMSHPNQLELPGIKPIWWNVGCPTTPLSPRCRSSKPAFKRWCNSEPSGTLRYSVPRRCGGDATDP